MATTRQPIILRSDGALRGTLVEVEAAVAQMRGSMPIVFAAGPEGWDGHLVVEALPAVETGVTVRVRGARLTAAGFAGGTEEEVEPWPARDGMVVAFAGEGRGTVFASRSEEAAPSETPRPPRSYAWWSYDGEMARIAAIWVGTYMAECATEVAVRWNGAVQALSAHGDGELQRLLRERRRRSRDTAAADDAEPAREAPLPLGTDMRVARRAAAEDAPCRS